MIVGGVYPGSYFVFGATPAPTVRYTGRAYGQVTLAPSNVARVAIGPKVAGTETLTGAITGTEILT